MAPLPKTMRAVRIHEYGAPESLRYEEIPVPAPGLAELLVRVHAAGVNPIDTKIRGGRVRAAFGEIPLPLIPGWDFSGTVVATGLGIGDYRPGDEVMGYVSLPASGCYAEYVVVHARDVVRRPLNLDHERAAALPLAGLTALQVLAAAGAAEGARVLIHGGAGGVGHLAVQIARLMGATVLATAGPSNQDYLRELGVHQAIDYKGAHLTEQVQEPVDAVVDLVGPETHEASWLVLRRGGTFVSIVTAPDAERARSAGAARADWVFLHASTAQLAHLLTWVATDKLRVDVAAALPLAEASEAHRRIESQRTRGKIVLLP